MEGVEEKRRICFLGEEKINIPQRGVLPGAKTCRGEGEWIEELQKINRSFQGRNKNPGTLKCKEKIQSKRKREKKRRHRERREGRIRSLRSDEDRSASSQRRELTTRRKKKGGGVSQPQKGGTYLSRSRKRGGKLIRQSRGNRRKKKANP